MRYGDLLLCMSVNVVILEAILLRFSLEIIFSEMIEVLAAAVFLLRSRKISVASSLNHVKKLNPFL